LTRARAAWCLEVLGIAIELPALQRAVGLDVLASRWCIDKHTLARLDVFYFGGRHYVDDDCRCDGWAGKSWQTNA
jgi:hypothetical protein